MDSKKIKNIIIIVLLAFIFYNVWDFISTDKMQNYIDRNSDKSWAPNVQYYLGGIYLTIYTSTYDKAEVCYRRMDERYPKSEYTPESLYQLGAIYELTKRFGLAKEAYKKIIDQYPSYEKIKKVQNRFWILTNN
ncbi:MAG: hypothetical protein A2539_05460 [Elusimicrobia bacterium RIFOXYD2_FULL_34_15]|nr:MAG: hypothetical protein A2539_05460 [Elusimicrobia bacterium RIFOXYD2_FULL_34_15]